MSFIYSLIIHSRMMLHLQTDVWYPAAK